MEMDYKWLSEEVLAVDNLAPANIITASTYTFGMLYAKAMLRLLSLLGAKEEAKHKEGFVRAEYYLNPKYKHAIDYHLEYLDVSAILNMRESWKCQISMSVVIIMAIHTHSMSIIVMITLTRQEVQVIFLSVLSYFGSNYTTAFVGNLRK